MKKVISAAAVAMLLFGLVLGCAPTPTPTPAPAPAPTEPIVLKATVPLPVFIPLMAPPVEIFASMVEERTNGQVIIEILGKPEVIPTDDQADAAAKGLIDISFIWGGDYLHIVPIASATHLTPYWDAPWEEREVGIYDFLVEQHKKYGLYYLGRWAADMRYYIYTSEKEIKTLSDFQGLKINDPMEIHEFVEDLGAIPLDITGTENFTALERGTIDGYIWGDFGKFPGWEEETKYVVDEGFLGMGMATLINLDVWNGLPPDVQELLMQIAVDFEYAAVDWYREGIAAERQFYMDAGAKFVELPPDEAKYLTDKAYEVGWKVVKDFVSPGLYEEARALLAR